MLSKPEKQFSKFIFELQVLFFCLRFVQNQSKILSVLRLKEKGENAICLKS